MNPIRYSCDGIRVISVWVPPFQLRVGDTLCLHMPADLPYFEELNPVIEILTGKWAVPGVNPVGRTLFARQPSRPAGLLRFLLPTRAANWFARTAGVTLDEARAVTAKLGIPARQRLEQLEVAKARLLGLEVAWVRGAEVLLFSTSGCDLAGRMTLFDAVSGRLDAWAAVHLNYHSPKDDPDECKCFPGATCLEVTREPGKTSILLGELPLAIAAHQGVAPPQAAAAGVVRPPRGDDE